VEQTRPDLPQAQDVHAPAEQEHGILIKFLVFSNQSQLGVTAKRKKI
jgi:hypothetical protein